RILPCGVCSNNYTFRLKPENARLRQLLRTWGTLTDWIDEFQWNLFTSSALCSSRILFFQWVRLRIPMGSKQPLRQDIFATLSRLASGWSISCKRFSYLVKVWLS